MKKIKIILILIAIFLPTIVFAGKGYNPSVGLTWSKSSGTRYCPSGKVLLGNSQKVKPNKWSGSAICYNVDNTPPTINVNSNGYSLGGWTKKEKVTLNFGVTDSQSGLGKIVYKINGEETVASANFSIDFTEEGEYLVQIIAEDKATIEGNGGQASSPNKSVKNVIVKIDRTAPIFTAEPVDWSGEWKSEKPTINFKIDDKYKGEEWISKTFNCGTLPANATWSGSDGTVEGFCKKNTTNTCSNESNFYPNTSICKYTCDAGYILGKDGLCHEETISMQCSYSLYDSSKYKYNKDDNLITDGSSQSILTWVSPSGVNANGNFYGSYNINSGTYSPSTNECKAKCGGGYHNEYSKCVNDSKIVCCDEPYLANSTLGGYVDCTKPENQSKIECSYSSLCGYKKELFGSWDYSASHWDYTTTTDGTLHGETGKYQQCGFEIFANSNGKTCNPKYYLIIVNNKPAKCENVPVGYYSGQENNYQACTNAPGNANYTSNGDNNNCAWQCKSGYNKVGGKCVGYTPATSCTPIKISSYSNTSKAAGGKVAYTSSKYPSKVNFSFDVWSEDLFYNIKCYDNAGNVIKSFGPGPGKDSSDDIDHYKSDCYANKISITVTEGGSEGTTSIGYKLYGNKLCK